MDIVDSQVHIWGADTPARPWPAGRGPEWVMGRGVREWLGWR